jgi:hypothetical protein
MILRISFSEYYHKQLKEEFSYMEADSLSVLWLWEILISWNNIDIVLNWDSVVISSGHSYLAFIWLVIIDLRGSVVLLLLPLLISLNRRNHNILVISDDNFSIFTRVINRSKRVIVRALSFITNHCYRGWTERIGWIGEIGWISSISWVRANCYGWVSCDSVVVSFDDSKVISSVYGFSNVEGAWSTGSLISWITRSRLVSTDFVIVTRD